ncbi:thiopurine S-methyltransferase [Tenacibaculum skagerrakense]|uniref:Thiopurine S-methyltransferase n=1 Tax=Tenacibaculum skagerrakense TaxID=186571 RepID=A0A4R2NZU8_9FLAO|nr:methyltransferase domain-containing protein [Tenacibaculum skagerrakense]TCP27879.1 thiopurine S-methyltransferase [Tenacibaculum skagerrakense]
MDTKEYWSQRYKESNTGWDLGAASPPLQHYINQISNKELTILIPGAGNSYEAEYLFNNGFKNVHVLDIAKEPLAAFAQRNPTFPVEHLHENDFFEFEGQFDLIIEQTFFCSFPPLPETRKAYATKMNELLKPYGKLVGLWFTFPLTGDLENRPFGGDKEEYLSYFSPYFEIQTFEPCYNSIPPRQGNELFGIFRVKK